MLPRKRLKVSRACDLCRRKKIRCDAVYTGGFLQRVCTNCGKNGVRCEFSRTPLKRGPAKELDERGLDRPSERVERETTGRPLERVEGIEGLRVVKERNGGDGGESVNFGGNITAAGAASVPGGVNEERNANGFGGEKIVNGGNLDNNSASGHNRPFDTARNASTLNGSATIYAAGNSDNTVNGDSSSANAVGRSNLSHINHTTGVPFYQNSNNSNHTPHRSVSGNSETGNGAKNGAPGYNPAGHNPAGVSYNNKDNTTPHGSSGGSVIGSHSSLVIQSLESLPNLSSHPLSQIHNLNNATHNSNNSSNPYQAHLSHHYSAHPHSTNFNSTNPSHPPHHGSHASIHHGDNNQLSGKSHTGMSIPGYNTNHNNNHSQSHNVNHPHHQNGESVLYNCHDTPPQHRHGLPDHQLVNSHRHSLSGSNHGQLYQETGSSINNTTSSHRLKRNQSQSGLNYGPVQPNHQNNYSIDQKLNYPGDRSHLKRSNLIGNQAGDSNGLAPHIQPGASNGDVKQPINESLSRNNLIGSKSTKHDNIKSDTNSTLGSSPRHLSAPRLPYFYKSPTIPTTNTPTAVPPIILPPINYPKPTGFQTNYEAGSSTSDKTPFWKVPYEMPQQGNDSNISRRGSIDSILSQSTTGSRFPNLIPNISLNLDVSDSEDDFYSLKSTRSHQSPRNSVSSLSSLNGRMNKNLYIGYNIIQQLNLHQNLNIYYNSFHPNFPILPFNKESLMEKLDDGKLSELFNQSLAHLINFKRNSLTDHVTLLQKVIGLYPFNISQIQINDSALIVFFSSLILINYAILLNGDCYSITTAMTLSVFSQFKVLENFLGYVKQKGNLDYDNVILYLPKLYYCLMIIDNLSSLAYGAQLLIPSNNLTKVLIENLNLLIPQVSQSPNMDVFRYNSKFLILIELRNDRLVNQDSSISKKFDANVQSTDDYQSKFNKNFFQLIQDKLDLYDEMFTIHRVMEKSLTSHDIDDVYETIMDNNFKLIRLLKKATQLILIVASDIDKNEISGVTNPFLNLVTCQLFKLLHLIKMIIDNLISILTQIQDTHNQELLNRCVKINLDLSTSYILLNTNFNKLDLGTITLNLIRNELGKYNFEFDLSKRPDQPKNMSKSDLISSTSQFLKLVIPILEKENIDGWC